MKDHTSLARAFAALALLVAITLTTFGQPIPGQYIAVFKDDVPDPARAAQELEAQHGLNVSYVYQNSIRGFAFAGSEQAAQALARNPRIAYVEQDQLAHASSTIPTGVGRIGIDTGALGAIQSDPDVSPDGQKVAANIVILDTGIQRDHPDLNVDLTGVRPYFKTVKGKTQIVFDNAFDDDNGHGTHVAGTAAANGAIVGVAPGALLTAVKVLGANGSGSYSIVIAGVDWVAGQPERFDVANMSLGGGFSQAVNDAIKNATSKGIVFAVAAGNAGSDVSQFSPASEPTAITVSAMVDFDGLPDALDTTHTYTSCKNSDGTGGTVHYDEEVPCFSNYGAGVDICAPGVLIYSTWPTSLGDLTGYNTISGTSMATPHVAGAAALYIAKNRASRTQTLSWVEEVTQALTSSGWRVGDYGYFDYYTRESFTVRTTGDKDPEREPLLNASALLGLTARPSPDFVVNINSTEGTKSDDGRFVSGTPITFTGTASLGGVDWTSSLVWISNLDGPIGTGSSPTASLSDGTHMIVASVPDSVSTFGGAASITIISGSASPAPKQLFIVVSTDKPVYVNGETMHSYFDVTDELGAVVPDAWVSGVLKTPAGGTLTASGATDANGRFEATAKLNGNRGGFGKYTITGSATKTGYLRSTEATTEFELVK